MRSTHRRRSAGSVGEPPLRHAAHAVARVDVVADLRAAPRPQFCPAGIVGVIAAPASVPEVQAGPALALLDHGLDDGDDHLAAAALGLCRQVRSGHHGVERVVRPCAQLQAAQVPDKEARRDRLLDVRQNLVAARGSLHPGRLLFPVQQRQEGLPVKRGAAPDLVSLLGRVTDREVLEVAHQGVDVGDRAEGLPDRHVAVRGLGQTARHRGPSPHPRQPGGHVGRFGHVLRLLLEVCLHGPVELHRVLDGLLLLQQLLLLIRVLRLERLGSLLVVLPDVRHVLRDLAVHLLQLGLPVGLLPLQLVQDVVPLLAQQADRRLVLDLVFVLLFGRLRELRALRVRVAAAHPLQEGGQDPLVARDADLVAPLHLALGVLHPHAGDPAHLLGVVQLVADGLLLLLEGQPPLRGLLIHPGLLALHELELRGQRLLPLHLLADLGLLPLDPALEVLPLLPEIVQVLVVAVLQVVHLIHQPRLLGLDLGPSGHHFVLELVVLPALLVDLAVELVHLLLPRAFPLQAPLLVVILVSEVLHAADSLLAVADLTAVSAAADRHVVVVLLVDAGHRAPDHLAGLLPQDLLGGLRLLLHDDLLHLLQLDLLLQVANLDLLLLLDVLHLPLQLDQVLLQGLVLLLGLLDGRGHPHLPLQCFLRRPDHLLQIAHLLEAYLLRDHLVPAERVPLGLCHLEVPLLVLHHFLELLHLLDLLRLDLLDHLFLLLLLLLLLPPLPLELLLQHPELQLLRGLLALYLVLHVLLLLLRLQFRHLDAIQLLRQLGVLPVLHSAYLVQELCLLLYRLRDDRFLHLHLLQLLPHRIDLELAPLAELHVDLLRCGDAVRALDQDLLAQLPDLLAVEQVDAALAAPAPGARCRHSAA
mmetsp:Transcript_7967/g.17262  ORF Transcript_7967/g.17262 Transcript_7967/m.17262 type:complete len:870 (-) Transcript_7967:588-3197(-)